MKQAIKPGGILDALTLGEFTDHMERHNDLLLQALGRNAQFKRAILQEVAGINGAFNVQVGPPDGFMWDVRAIIFNGGPLTRANLFINDVASTTNYLGEYVTAATPPYTFSKQIVLHSSDVLCFTNSPNGTQLVAGAQVAVQLLVVEVPNSHEAQLLL